MSASHWAICPKCLAEAQSREAMERAVVMNSYGKVPVEEFDAARASLEPVDPEVYTTLREDYQFYDAETGTVRYYYRCKCTTCGITADLKGEQQFWPTP